jgi:dolichyl-phosphate beta-glucosyltransferase
MSTPEKTAFSIVIPAYNEASRLPPNIPAVAAHCESLVPRWGAAQVVVSVERSTDGTLEKTRAAAASFPWIDVIDNGPQRGKGHAVREGMLRAKGEIIFFMDADLSTPLEEIGHFLEHFAAHPEVDAIIGNRRHSGSRIVQRQGPLRRGLSAVFNAMVQKVALPGCWADTQCGFKAFRRRAAREIFSRQRLDGFSFDVEALLLASALGFRVVDLPVEWADAAATKLHVLRDGWSMLRDLVQVRALVSRTLREQPPGPSA